MGHIYEYVCSYNRYHVNGIKGFWAFWDNIYEHVCLCTILYFSVIFDGQFADNLIDHKENSAIFTGLFEKTHETSI
jgi:hypothetical protein